MNYKKIFTGLLFAIITIISTGCGEHSFFDKADDTASSSIIMLHGNIAKGPIYKAEVKAFRLDTNKLLNTVLTDIKGDYSLDIGTYTGAIKVTAKGGSYIDEISGIKQDAKDLNLEAISVISDDKKVKTVNVTPVTDIAAQELEDMYEDITKLANKKSIIEDVNKNIARILTGSSFNPTKVKPKILGKDKIELDDGDAGKYGTFLAVFAKLSDSKVSNVKAKIENFYNDIKDNGVLSEDSNTKIKGALEDNTIKKGINTEVITFIKNQQKTYDITPIITGTLIKTNQKREGKTEFTLSVKDIDTKVLVHFKNKKSFATFEAKDENGKDIVYINNDSTVTVIITNSKDFNETRSVTLSVGKETVTLSSTSNKETTSNLSESESKPFNLISKISYNLNFNKHFSDPDDNDKFKTKPYETNEWQTTLTFTTKSPLPKGIILDTNGLLNGASEEPKPKTFPITITATDIYKNTITRTVSLNVSVKPQVASIELKSPNSTRLKENQTVQATLKFNQDINITTAGTMEITFANNAGTTGSFDIPQGNISQDTGIEITITAGSGSISEVIASKITLVDTEITNFLTIAGQEVKNLAIDNAAPLWTSVSNIYVSEDTGTDTVIYTSKVNDDDKDVTYSISDDNFTITTKGKLSLKKALDYETTKKYTLEITVKDSLLNSSAKTVTINVTNVLDTPPLLATPKTTENIAEDIKKGTSIATISSALNALEDQKIIDSFTITSGDDNNNFTVNNKGVVKIAEKSHIDFSVNTTHTYILKISASNKAGASKKVTLNIPVTNVNEITAKDDKKTMKNTENSIIIDVLANDDKGIDNKDLTIKSVTVPNIGTAEIIDDNKIKYTNTSTDTGTISFTYTMTNGEDDNTANVNISIIDATLVPDAPTVNTIADDDIINSLESKSAVNITGTATPDIKVTVTYNDISKTVKNVGSDGKWSVKYEVTELPSNGTSSEVVAYTTTVFGTESLKSKKTLKIDTTKPTVTITNDKSVDTLNKTDNTVTFTFSFSEEIKSFTANDITVQNGEKSTFKSVITDKKWTLAVIANDNSTKAITVSINLDIEDKAGNKLSSEGNKLDDEKKLVSKSIKVDTREVTLEVTFPIMEDGIISKAEEERVIISGTTNGRKVEVTIATLDKVDANVNDDGKWATKGINISSLPEGALTLVIKASKNGNIKTLTYNDKILKDTLSPTISELIIPTTSLLNENEFKISFKFDTFVTPMKLPMKDNFILKNVDLISNVYNPTSKIYTVTFKPKDDDEGTLKIILNKNAVESIAGNGNKEKDLYTRSFNSKYPTITITSHKEGQFIDESEALDITLKGKTKNAIKPSKVTITNVTTNKIIGTTTVDENNKWSQHITGLIQEIQKLYTGTKPLVSYKTKDNYATISSNSQGFNDLRNLFDGNKQYGKSYSTDFGRYKNGATFTITFTNPQFIKFIDIWGGARNYALNARWDFYDTDKNIVKTIQKDKYDEDRYYKVFPHVLTPIKKIIVTKTGDDWFSFSEMKINAINLSFKASVESTTGNKASTSINFNITKHPDITSIKLDKSLILNGKTMQITVNFDTKIKTSTFTKDDFIVTNGEINSINFTTVDNKTVATAIFIPTPEIDASVNTIKIGKDWKNFAGINASEKYESENYKIYTKLTVVNQVSFALHSTPYHIGESVKIRVAFNKKVTVAGTPSLNIGLNGSSTTKQASYLSGSGTKILLFAYSIKSGDSATAISVDADINVSNTNTIKDIESTANVNPAFTAIDPDDRHIVNTDKDGIVSIIVTSNPSKTSYVKDDKINFKVTFSNDVTVTNTPTLSLVVGDKTVKAIYKNGSGTNINFTYTVEDNSFDADGISISKNAMLLAEGTIKSSNDSVLLYNAQISNIKGQTVNSLTPYIKDITLSATKSGLNETAIVGDTLKASFTFNSNVTLEGTGISLKAKIGSEDISMAFFSQEANKLIFTYTIVENDSSISGFNLIKNSLILKSGTTLKSSINDKDVALNHFATSNNTKIDGIKPTLVITAPKKVNKDFTITLSSSKELSSIDKSKISVSALFDVSEFKLAADKKSATLKMTLKADTKSNEKNQDIKVTFQAAAFTDTSGLKSKKQEKTIKFDNNTTLSITNPIEDKIYTLKEMQNMNISGTTDAEAGQTVKVNDIFDVEVQADGTWSKKVNLLTSINTASPVTKAYINASVKDKLGNKASVTKTVNMDITVPTVTITLDSTTILVDKKLKATINFNEAVQDFDIDDINTTNGTLSDFIHISDTEKSVIFTPNSEIKVDDVKIIVGQNFTDLFNNHPSSDTSSASFSIDTLIGKINNIFILPHVDDTIPFVTNEEINIRVAFEESVIVKGIPSIKILLHKADDTTVEAKATFKNAINTKVLNFIYKVQAGDLYSAMSIPKGDIDLNEGSIKLLSTNDANISYENVPENTNIKINSTITSISSISISSNPGADKTYTTGDKVEFKVEFTKAITITNTNAKLKFTLDETVKEASYKSGNDNTILFEYLIVSGDKDTNGISINSNAIAANSFGENIFLNNVAIASDENHKVSTTGSTIQHSYFETKPSIYYKAGDTITAILEFNENVVLTTSKLKPSLTLKLGDKLVKAQYKTIEDTKMYFSYIVQDKDTAKQGASIVKNSLNLNFAQLQNIVGLDVKLELNSLINAKNIIIDTLVPTLTIKIPKNQNKDFTVTIEASEEITIKDTNKFSINQGSINKIDLNENKKTITIKINAPTSYDGDISLKIETGAVEDKARNSNTLTTETSFFSTSKPTISITTPLNNTKHLVDDGVLITGVSNIEDDQKITAKVGELKVGDFVVKNGKFEAIIPRAYFSKKYRYVRAYFASEADKEVGITELVVLDSKGKFLELNKKISLFKKVDDDYVKAIELDDGVINGTRGQYSSGGRGIANIPSGKYYLDLDLLDKYSIALISLDTSSTATGKDIILQVSNDKITWDTIKSYKDHGTNIRNNNWPTPFMAESTKIKFYATNKYGTSSVEVSRDLKGSLKATAKISLDKTVVKLGEDINISITLSPNTDLNSFTKDDIIAPNGTLGDLKTDPNNAYKKYISFTPSLNINDATNVITLKNTWTNKASINAFTTTSKNYEVATKPVTITITDDQDKVTNKEIKYTFKLSSPSTSFTIEDIDIVPATAVKSNFTGSGDSYSLKVTPPEDYKGDLTLTIQTDKLNDKNNIGNLQAKHIQKVNTKAMPKPTIDDISTLTSFTETVTITGTGQVGATITIEFNNSKDTATVDNTKNWSLTLSNTNNLENDTYTIKAVMSDEAGNSNFARKTFTINLPASTPTLFIDSIIMVDNIINSFEAYNTKVSGKAKNLNNEVLTLKIGTITNTTTVSDDKWSIDNIDISSLDDGDITIIATVNNLSRSITILKDTEPMIPTFTTPKLLVNKDFNITLEFSKDVIGFDITKLKITNATISSLTKINDKKYTLAIDTSSITTKATVSVSIKKDTLFTRVGSKISDTKIEVIVDKTPPTLSFTSHEDNQLIGQNEASNLTLEGTTNTEEGQEVSLSFGGVDFKTATVEENGIWKKENINLGISSLKQITTSTNLLRVDDISNNVNFVKVSGGIKSWYSMLTDNSIGSYEETWEATTFRYDFKDIYTKGKFYIAFSNNFNERIPGQKVKFYLFDKLVYTSPSSTWASSLAGNLSTNINFNRVDFVLTASGARVTEFKVYGQSIDRKFTAKVTNKVGNEASANINLRITNSPTISTLSISDKKLKKDATATLVVTFNNAVNITTFNKDDITAPNASLGEFTWSNDNKTLTTNLTPINNTQYDNTNRIVVGKEWNDVNDGNPLNEYTSVNYEVDTKSPAITNIAITSNAGEDKTYVTGDTITLEASFDEKITSAGDATIKIKIGEVEKTLSASVVTSSNNTNKLIFEYTVKAGDEDTNGISVIGNTLKGNIFDTFKNEANTTDLSFTDIDSNLDHKVQSIKVDISNITFMSTPLDNNTYVEGEVIEIKLEISKPVIVLGEPTIDLEIGESIKKAIYMPTDKYTKILIFKYTVAQGDYDTDGIKIKANSLTLNKGSILDTNNQSLGLTFAKTINSNAKVDTLVSTIVITGPKHVNSAFDITVTLNKSRTTALLITVSNGTPLLLESNQKVYKYTITPNQDFNGDVTISIGKTTKTVVVDIIPPSLKITSVFKAEPMTLQEASNLTLEGTSSAENDQEVHLYIKDTLLGSTKVTDGKWSKSAIALKDKYYRYVRVYSDGSDQNTGNHIIELEVYDTDNVNVASGKTVTGYKVSDNEPIVIQNSSRITDGSKTNLNYYSSISAGYIYTLLDLGGLHELKSIKVWRYFNGRKYNKAHIKVSNDNVNWLSVYDGSTPYAEWSSGKEFKTIPYTTIRGSTTLTAKVKDKAGNETSATISLEVEKSPLVNKITIGKTKLNKDSSAKVEIRFNSEVSSKTFDLNFLEAANAKLVFVVDHDESGKDWTHEKNVLHLILTPKPNIQYDNTNKIVVKKGWIDNKGHSNESSYTSVNYEVDTKSPAITNIAITSNAGEDKTYAIGDTITLEASFDEKITSAGEAKIKIKIGEVEKTLSASVVTSSNNTNKLVFKYIVKTGDEDINGISVVGNTLTGNIFDTFRNEANKTDLSFVTILNKPNHKIKALEMLHILNINFSSNPQSNSTYVKDEDIKIELTISAPVVITLGATIDLEIGKDIKKAIYDSISADNKTLTFVYKVKEGDYDNDGIKIKANSLMLNKAEINGADGQILNLTFANITSYDKVNALPLTLVIDAPLRVKAAFDITVTLAQKAIPPAVEVSNATFKILGDNNVSKTVYKYTITPDSGFNGDVTITIGKTTKIVVVDIQAPTLTFNQVENTISPEKASNLTLEGTSSAENDQVVNLYIEDTFLGSTKVTGTTDTIDGTWSKSGLKLLENVANPDKGVVETYSGTKASMAGSSYADIRHIFDGNKAYGYSTATDFGEGLTKNFTTIFKVSTSLDHIRLYGGEGKNYRNYTLNAKWDFYDSNNEIVKTVTPTSYDKDYYFDIQLDGLFIKKIVATNRTSTYFSITELEIYRVNTNPVVTAKVQDQAGNEASATISLKVAHLPGIKIITINKTKFKKGSNASVEIKFTSEVNKAFTKNNITTPNATLSDLVWSNENKTATATLTPKDGIQYDDTNKIVVEKGWSDKEGHTNESSYTSVNYEVDTKSPVLKRVVIFSNAGEDKTYEIGDKITLEASFDENITSSDAKIIIKIGAKEEAIDLTTANSNKLTFEYIVKDGDEDINGVSVVENTLTGNIFDTLGNKATDIAFDAINNSTSHKVSTAIATIKKISITSQADHGSYRVNDNITITVEFTKNVTVTNMDNNKPYIFIKVGEKQKQATYSSIDNTKMKFTYKVQKGDNDTDGISILKGKIILNGATVKNANIEYYDKELTDDPNHKVDTQAPILTFTNKNIVTSNFTIKVTANEPIQALSGDLITVSNNVSIDKITKNSDKEYTINFKIGNDTAENKDIVITFAKGAIQDIHDNGNESKIITIKYDKTPPTLSFTSHSKNQSIGRLSNLTIAGTSDEIGAKVTLKLENKSLGTVIVQNDGSWKKENINLGISSPRKITYEWTNLLRVDGIPNNSNFVRVSGGISSWYYTLSDTNKTSWRESFSAKTYRYNFKDIYTNAHFYLHYQPGGAKAWKIRRPGQRVKFYLNDTLVYTSPVSGQENYFSKWVNPSMKFNRVDLVLNGSGARVTEFEVFGKSVDKINLSANVKDEAGNTKSTTLPLNLAASPIIKQLTISNKKLKKGDQANLVFTFNNAVKIDTFTTANITTPNASLGEFTWSNDNKTATATLTPKDGIQYDGTNKIVVDKEWSDINDINPLNEYTSVNYEVDTTSPVLERVVISSNPKADSIYRIGDTITLEVSFDENITSSDAKIKIDIGGVEKILEVATSSTNKLIFKYIVKVGDEDTDGISIKANLTGDIFDTLKNKAEASNLKFDAVTNSILHKVKTDKSNIKAINITSKPSTINEISDTYIVDNEIEITTTFTKPISISSLDDFNKPYIIINIGGVMKYAIYKEVSDGLKMTFIYKVQKGELDTNGISVPKGKIMLNGAIVKTNDIIADIQYNNISDDANHKVDTQAPTLTFTNKNAVNSDFTIKVTVNEPIQVPNSSLITASNHVSIDGTPVISTNKKEYTINFKIDNTTTENKDIVITFAKGAIQDIHDNGNEIKTVTIKYNKTPPTLSFTSHEDNGEIYIKEALDLTLAGTTNAEDGQSVSLSVGTTSLGIATVQNGTWSKSAIALKDKYYQYVRVYGDGSNKNDGTHLVEVEVYDTNNVNVARGKAVQGYRVIDNQPFSITESSRITDGSKSDKYSYSDIGDGYKYVLLDLGGLHELKSIKVWRYFDGRKYNKTHIKVSKDNVTWLSVYDGSTPYAEWSSGREFTTIPYTKILGEITLTAKVEDKAGNKTSKSISLTIEDFPRIETLTIDNTKLKKDATATLKFTFNTKINTSTFSKNDITTPNATLSDFTWNDDNNIATATLTPQSNIQYKATNKIVVDNSWRDFHGHFGLKYTGINYEVDTKNPILEEVIITSNGDDNIYAIGDTVTLEASFNENVTSKNAIIKVNIGTKERDLELIESSKNQKSSNKLSFAYTITDDDKDANGINVLANSITGDIFDTLDNKAEKNDLLFSAIYHSFSHTISTAIATIKTLKITSMPTSHTYGKDADIDITVEFTRAIEVALDEDKKPYIIINVGGIGKYAYYKSYSDSKIIFTYKVKKGDLDTNGISVPAAEIELNSATIKTANSKNADIRYYKISITDDSNHKVDTLPPVITFKYPDKVNGTFNVIISANEKIKEPSNGSISISNGSISVGDITKNSDTKYTIEFNVSDDASETELKITFAKGAIQDISGNEYEEKAINITIDKTSPALAITSHTNNQWIDKSEAADLTLSGTSEAGAKVNLSFGGVDFKTATVEENGIWKKENINLGISSPKQITTSTNLLRVDDISNNSDFVSVSGGIKSWYSILTDNSTSSAWGSYKETWTATTFRYDFKDIYNNGKFYIAFATTQVSRRPGQKVKFYLFDKLVYTSPSSSTWSSSLAGNLSTNINFNRVDFVLTASGARVTEFKVYGQSIDRKFTAKATDEAGNETSAELNLKIVDGFTLLSDSVKEGTALDKKYSYSTADETRENISPQLKWGAAPADTKSYAIIMDDTTANNWIHWNVFNIPKTITSFEEGWSSTHSNANSDGIQQNTAQGITEPANKYVGPWPDNHPIAKHTYQIKIYALNIETLDDNTSTQNTVSFESTHGTNILGSTTLTFTFTAPLSSER